MGINWVDEKPTSVVSEFASNEAPSKLQGMIMDTTLLIPKKDQVHHDPMGQLHSFLSTFHCATLEHSSYVVPWFPPSALAYFLTNAVEVKPRAILFGVGRPLHCRENAFETAIALPRTKPWFGFRLTWMDDGWRWWLHAWAITPTGSIIDSGPEGLGCRYVGVLWTKEFHECLPKVNWDT